MSIGEDIKEVLEEVGISYTIIRDSGNVTGEYTMVKGNAQVTKPFVREFFLEGTISYDTVLDVGDLIEFVKSGNRYRLMNKTPNFLEDEIYQFLCVLYKTNVVCDILRPSNPDPDSQTYKTDTEWTHIKSQVDVLITSPLYGNELETDEELGLLGVEVHEMYVPSSWGIQVFDRVRISSLEYYRVETIKPRRYDGIDVIELGEDQRVACSTTSTTTTFSTTSSTTTTTA